MKRFAIVENGEVINTVIAPDDFTGGVQSDIANIGDLFDGSVFISPVSMALPEIVITSIISDKPGSVIKPDFSDIMCLVGSQLTCMAELRAQDGSVIPLTDTFKMPLRSRDNRERFVFVAFESGLATFSGAMNESGLWSINQEAINSGLPVEQHMTMKEVLIYVCI